MERAILVITEYEKTNWTLEDMSLELKELATAVRVEAVSKIECKLKQISPAHFVGSGKIDEITILADKENVDVVIFNDDLTGTQQKNIEDVIGRKTIDRTQLILDIFSRRAKSNEGKVQVELAQLEYLLPRLTGKGIMLSRLGGGIGTRGPGEMKLELDRRRISTRISKLKKDLEGIEEQRRMRRKSRARFSASSIALVGYTNAGKSTLLNTLTNSNVSVDNRLFSTLDPTIRKYVLPNNQKIIFIDTVGFLYKLPHHLIDAFHATLEEAIDADILLHVLDANEPKVRQHSDAVYDVLRELKIEHKPIITVLNKMDKIEDPSSRLRLQKDFKDAIPISSLCNENLKELINRIVLKLSGLITLVKLKIPLGKIKLLYAIYREGRVISKKYHGRYVYIEAQIPETLKKKFLEKELTSTK